MNTEFQDKITILRSLGMTVGTKSKPTVKKRVALMMSQIHGSNPGKSPLQLSCRHLARYIMAQAPSVDMGTWGWNKEVRETVYKYCGPEPKGGWYRHREDAKFLGK